MQRKWFGLAAGLAALGLGMGMTALTFADDEKETPLGLIMEKVQKNKSTITKGVRNVAAYKKSQADVEKAAKEWVKQAKEAKPLNDVVKTAKGQADPQKKWDELMDVWSKESQKLAEMAAKSDSSQKDVKDQLNTINKNCTECHTVFRIEEDF
jgi:cytochrome c556